MKLFLSTVSVLSATLALVLPASVFGQAAAERSLRGNEKVPAMEEEFDRLDGMGNSGKKVNVIEWEGNLEVHVYPAGSLSGLALKLVENAQKTKVMVIGYRFNNKPKEQLIRRAVLGIPIKAPFKTYKDLSATEYDKIIISNNGLSLSPTLLTYALDPEPKQLYPDGHPMLAGNGAAAGAGDGSDAAGYGQLDGEERSPAGRVGQGAGDSDRIPGAVKFGELPTTQWKRESKPAINSPEPGEGAGQDSRRAPPQNIDRETGTIRSFSF